MVLRMRRFFKDNGIYILFALAVTILVNSPYLFRDFLGIEHDTFFHLSRIEGLADAISRGDFLSALYPYKNNGYGYGSPLFYSDFLLIPAALIYLAGFSLSFCYKQYVFVVTFISLFTMALLVKMIVKKEAAVYIGTAAYAFANYRITDIYVRGALGELTALSFLPLVILGLYEILMEGNVKRWPVLCAGLSLLALSHNISFLFGIIVCLILFFVCIKKVDRGIFLSLCKATGLAFLLTAFFTIPMLEQVFSQDLVLKHWGGDLGSQTMVLRQYLANTTVFGYGGHTYDSSLSMLENAGWFLELAPLLYFAVKKEKRRKHPFVKYCLIIGYVFMLLPSDIVPWGSLRFLGIIQFPWRLSMLAMTFLVIPAGFAIGNLFSKRIFTVLLLVIMSLEALYHVIPAFSRTFGITSKTTYSDIVEGRIIDPYYSADYMRVELAGGDYLNMAHPDFRGRSTAVKDEEGNDTSITYVKEGTTLTLTVAEEGMTLIMPLSWYKGYKVYYLDGSQKREISCFMSDEAMVAFYAEKAGTYIVSYENTPLRNAMLIVSGLALCFAVIMGLRHLRKSVK